MLFLLILDEREEKEAEQAKAVGAEFRPSLEYPYRWRDWAAPSGTGPGTVDSQYRPEKEGTPGKHPSCVHVVREWRTHPTPA